MKLALIGDSKGIHTIRDFGLSYHLVLAQHVRSDPAYQDFYISCRRKGDFIMLDNGAAEDVMLSLHELLSAAQVVQPDEIVLPDVLGDYKATLDKTMHPTVLASIPVKQRAVCPQGNDIAEWLDCANIMSNEMDFVTLCVPKHLERFDGGRALTMRMIKDAGWTEQYNIHLLGIWGDPYSELLSLRPFFRDIRGIDTAMPFALAQGGVKLTKQRMSHIGHQWNKRFDKALASENVETLRQWID